MSIINSDARLTTMVVDSNQAGYYGGGIYVYYSAVEMDSMNIIRNYTQYSGGAGGVHFYSDGGGNNSVQISNSYIKHNVSIGNGGGIYNSAGLMIIENTKIDSNSAANRGGGLYSVNGSATIEIYESSLVGNITTNDNGGGIYVDNGGLHVENQDSKKLCIFSRRRSICIL